MNVVAFYLLTSVCMFRYWKDTVQIQRMVEADNKMSKTVIWTTIGYLKPVSNRNSQQYLERFWLDYTFNCHLTTNIQMWDEVVYWDEVFSVKSVAKFTWITFQYLDCLLTKHSNG